MHRSLLPILTGITLLASACDTSSGVEFRLPELVSARLSDQLTHGGSRCLFTLRLSSQDPRLDVDYSWAVDRQGSQLPGVDVQPESAAGSFRERHERTWEWRRPDDGSALILSVEYRLEASDFSTGGRLVTFCP